MDRTENEEPLSERRQNVNVISELPGRSFGVTIEVPLFLTLLSISLSGAAISNIILYRTCVHSLDHTEAECKFFLSPEKTNGSSILETEVQKYATFITTVKMILESVGPAILSFFLGVWSDTHGRKPLVVWPLLGLSMSFMMTVVYGILENFGPWWYLVTSIPSTLTGGFSVLIIGVFCYLTDVTTEEDRSMRMILLQAVSTMAIVIGSLASPYLLRIIGIVNLLLLASVTCVMSYVITNLWVQESLKNIVQGRISSVFKISLVKEMMYGCFKKRPNHGRTQILLLAAANFIIVFLWYGVANLEYMYTREKLHWSMSEYNKYMATRSTLSFVGSCLGGTFLQKVLGVKDMTLIFVGIFSGATDFLIRAFATDSWDMYLGAIIALFKELPSSLIKSIVTKMLPAAEISTILSLMCAIEGIICPLISPAMFNILYDSTIMAFSGAIYIISFAITGFCVVLLGIVQYYRCKVIHAYSPMDNDNEISS